MRLFGKKKEEIKTAPVCACHGNAVEIETKNMTNGDENNGISTIKVLGAGCKSCHAMYENVQEAVKAMGLPIETEYVTDMKKVMSYGVMSMPALVIDEKVVSMGKVLKTADVEKLIRKQ